jgi:hypothetical protein
MRTIDLAGTAMSALALAIPELEKRTNKPVIIIGGLAVTCRLSHPYRSTSDLDTVNRRAAGEQPQLEILLASDATPSGVSGVLIPTSAGPVQIDAPNCCSPRWTPKADRVLGVVDELDHPDLGPGRSEGSPAAVAC